MPSTNFMNVARVRESTLGVTPGSPNMENCFITGDSLKIAKQFVRSETITGDRAIKEHISVGLTVEGGGDFEFAFGYVDWGLELINFDSFAALEEAYNVTADSNITDISADDQDITAAGDWVEGMMLDLYDPDYADNCVQFVAQSGSGSGTAVAPAATLGDNNAAPGVGARLYCYGYQAASGDISATASGLASASNAFADLPLLPGMGMKIGGATSGLQFGTAALNDFVGIKSIAADGSAIELDELPAGWTTDAGTGKTIQLLIGDDSRTGEDVLSDSLQKRNTKSSPFFGQAFRGVAGQTLNLRFPQQDRVTGQLGIIGIAGELLTTALDASPVDPLIGVGDVMKTGSNIARLTEGGAAIAAAIACQDLNFNLGNNITPVGSIESDIAIDFNPGDAEITTEAQYRAGTKAILEKYLTDTPTKKMIVIKRGRYAYQFRVLSGIYTDLDAPVQGRNGEWITTARMEAFKDPVTGLLWVCTRYRRWQ